MSDSAQRYNNEYDAIMRRTEERAAGIERRSALPTPPQRGPDRSRLRPVAPVPSSFGLTEQRLQFFAKPVSEDPPLFLIKLCMALPMLAIFFLPWQVSLILGLLFWAISLVMLRTFSPWAALIMAMTLPMLGIAWLHGRLKPPRPVESEPDYPGYIRFLERTRQYERDMESYLGQQAAAARRERIERRKKLTWWEQLSGRQFEEELGELLLERGYTVTLTRASNDGGIDLIAQRYGQSQILIQCKARAGSIGVATVREFHGAISHYERRWGQVAECWILGKSGYTRDAKSFAAGTRIRLRDIREFLG